MTINVLDGEVFPGDFSRKLIVEYARRAANYADILRDLCDMRDDEGADVMRRRLIAEVNQINASFRTLAAKTGLSAKEASHAAGKPAEAGS